MIENSDFASCVQDFYRLEAQILEDQGAADRPTHSILCLQAVLLAYPCHATLVAKLREMSPLWDMVQDGIDLKTIQWTQH